MSFLEFKSEDEEAPGLAVRVEIERAVHPALERILHDEVQSVKMLQHVTLDRTADQAGEGALDTLGGQRALEPFEILRVVDPDIDVRVLPLSPARACAMSRTSRGSLRPRGLMRPGCPRA